MAKKGGGQQLQTDIVNDDDFVKFINRPGLIVFDVYSQWCGPCLGMVGSLRKIKLELGGDNLHLAIVKADTVSFVNRFYKKSEPTWLFVTHKRAVNLMFGTNVPKLMKLISHELDMLKSRQPRTTYAITELQPEEVKRKKVKEDQEARAKYIEDTAREKKRREYLIQVTNSIMENFPDIGVTVFGPQVNRDMFKKLMEPADALKIQCKDRRVVAVNKQNWETVNFACNNPLKPDVLEQLENKELLMCFWKIPDDTHKKVPDILRIYAGELMKQHTEPPRDGGTEPHIVPPLLTPLTVKVEIDLKDGEPCLYEQETIEIKEEFVDTPLPPVEPLDAPTGFEEEDGAAEGNADDIDAAADKVVGAEVTDEAAKEPEPVKIPTKQICVKSVVIPPVWVANNQRTHAALIYEFFRSQTAPFLPPDPVPEPPHVIMAFDAYKKKDLIDVAQRHKEDVPMYGFFTSDDVEKAKFIASSVQKYSSMQQAPTDKIIFKVSKATSYTMLSLATYGPSYVSPNINVGKDEAAKLFPESFKTADQEYLEMKEKEAADPKKKTKKRKSDAHATPVEAPVAESPPPPPTADEAAPSGEGAPAGDTPGQTAEAPGGESAPQPPTEEGAKAEGEAKPEGESSAEGATPAADAASKPEGDTNAEAESKPDADTETKPEATEEKPAEAEG